jgi:hypothetical protein
MQGVPARVIGIYGPELRPHLRADYSSMNGMSLCDSCDFKVEEGLTGNFLSALCDCDSYRRWICTKCVKAEVKETNEYLLDHTIAETDYERYKEMYGKTKLVIDHQFERLFYCSCGSVIPQDTIPRCTWCKRRHRPEDEWDVERREIDSEMPWYVDDYGCYPIYYEEYETGFAGDDYPWLRYTGPI